MNRYLSRELSVKLLQKVQASAHKTTYEHERHRLTLLDDAGNERIHFRLPIVLPRPDETSAPVFEDVHYVILLIQSGSCAMGYFENGENLDHKVFRSYMVRKKQGKSQIKYLKTKGKSRAGSRVRLAETLEFFENINERLQEYFEEYSIDRIAISCSKILIPYLYNSKVATPFTKQDERLFKIPKHVHTPIYGVMMDVHKFLLKGELIFDEAHLPEVEALLGSDAESLEDTEEDGNYETDENYDSDLEEEDDDDDKEY